MEFLIIENRKTNHYFSAFSHVGYIVEAPNLQTAKKYLMGGCFKELFDFKQKRTSKKIYIIGNYLNIKIINNIPDNLVSYWKNRGDDWSIYMYDEVGKENIEHIYNYTEDDMLEYIRYEYIIDDELIDVFVVTREFFEKNKFSGEEIKECDKWRV